MSTFVVLAAVFCILWILWLILSQLLRKQSLQNVPGPTSTSLISGILTEFFGGDAWSFHKDLLKNYGGLVRINGLLGDIAISVSDPKALHHIIVKDQHIFEEPTHFIESTRLLFGPGLLGSLGDEHRKQRKMLNPVFSIAHLRGMTPTFYKVSHKLEDALAKRVSRGPTEIDVYSWLSRTTVELVAQTGLGYSFDTLTEDGGQHPYSRAAKQLMPMLAETAGVAQLYSAPLMTIGSPKFRRLMLGLIPWKLMHEVRDIVDIMWDASVSIYESKKQALLREDEVFKDEVQEGKDIIAILMRANMSASDEDRLTDEVVLSQMGTLIFTAMDTTSSALSRILWLLSHHQDIQEKLRHELNTATDGGNHEIGYDELASLPYLDAICRESLRLYPPIPISKRVARQDVMLPLSKPIVGIDGTPMHEVLIPKDTTIMVHIVNCNCDPQMWGPDSYEFRPERWLEPFPYAVTSARVPGVYSHIMTFIGGGRACIGFKFAELEMKIVLSLLVQKFKFSPAHGKEITWKLNTVVSPAVAGDRGPQLPLVVESVQQ